MAKQPKNLANQPNDAEIQSVIKMLNLGKLADAESTALKLASRFPRVFILQHILGIVQSGLSKFTESSVSYAKAIAIQPGNPDLHFNLGIALTQIGRLDEAVTNYQRAISINSGFFEAYGNLGTVLQKQGKLEDAIKNYRKALDIKKDAQGHFNLGTALHGQGVLDEAINNFRHAIELFPNYTDALNYLGECLRDQGNMEDAIENYLNAMKINPKHPGANYNMGEFLYLSKRYDEAASYFECSQLDDWQERSLYCLYKAERFANFKEKLDEIVSSGKKHTAPFLATLSTHYATNFEVPDPYNFCKNGFDFLYQNSIEALARPKSQLLADLLNDVSNASIQERKQGMLHFGTQSAGNLFKRPEASFRKLGDLVKQEFINYKNRFKDADCELIKSFPNTLEFTSSWYVKMRSGGHLDAHIHEVGWISGAVYLALPTDKKDPTEGCFEYGIHGDNYPQKHTNFPVGIVNPNVGDIVLFPSSLFHRTIPFTSNEERICIAFDLRPEGEIFIRSNY